MLLSAKANQWHPKGVANQVQRVVCGLIGAEQGLMFWSSQSRHPRLISGTFGPLSLWERVRVRGNSLKYQANHPPLLPIVSIFTVLA